MEQKIFVVGVGMSRFYKPKKSPDYPELGIQAAQRALKDAGVEYSKIGAAAVGYVYSDSTAGQKILYELGMTGIPIVNVNNNCATGSTALYLARQAILSGTTDCALALGFETMKPGSLPVTFPEQPLPYSRHYQQMLELRKPSKAPGAPQMFGNAGREHMEKYGTKPIHFAKIAEKNHRHSTNNPYSQFQDLYTLEQISKSPEVYFPLTKLQCCPTSCGAAAAVVCNEKFMLANNLQDQAVEIVGISLKTDPLKTFEARKMTQIVGYTMAMQAAQEALKMAKISVDDCKVVELHDCFSANELITYEALGLCKAGQAGEFIDRGDNTYGGKFVVNPSGGLISKGHPLGATGLAQCTELCWQLRGMAQKRQVSDLKGYALQHNLGLGGACVVAVYKKYNNKPGKVRSDQTSDPKILEAEEAKRASLQPKL